MAFNYSPKIVRDNLILYLDAANTKSYISGSTTSYSLVTNTTYPTPLSCSLVNSVGYSVNNSGYFTLDGVDDQLLLENTPSRSTGIRLNSGTTPWMVNTWIRTSAAGNNSVNTFAILTNRSGGPVYCSMGIGAGGVMKYAHYSGSWIAETGSIAVNDNRWHMLSWVNLDNNTLDMYVDGVFNRNVPSMISPANVNAVDIIGASWSGGFINANLACITINIGTLFTSAHVAQNFNALRGRFGI